MYSDRLFRLSISRPELKIRREVLDWSAYHARAHRRRRAAQGLIFQLLLTLAFGNKNLESMKAHVFLLILFLPGLIKLIVLIVNLFLFKAL